MFPILAYFQKIIPAAGVCKHSMRLSTSLPFKNMRSPYKAPAGRGAPFNKFYPAPSRRFSSDEKCDKWPEWHGGDTKKLLGDANPYQAWENERLHKAIAANDVTAMKCVEGPVTMKDGAKGTLRVLSPKDVRDVERFYKTLLARSRQAIQDSPCLNRDRGDVPDFYQSYRFLTALGTDLILGVKAPIFSGGSQLLIAVTFYQRPRPGTNDRECWPYGTIVADGFQGKGLGTELKKAQIEWREDKRCDSPRD
jgi:hypothetical protein